MATSNKIERAYTSQGIRKLECAMVDNLGMDINSFDENEIKNPIKTPVEAQLTQFLGKGLSWRNPLSKT